MSNVHNVVLKSSLAIAILAGALCAPQANAAIRMSVSGGAACKASSGPGAEVFYFDANFAQNISASTQYLTCVIPEFNPGSSRAATSIEVLVRNPTGAAATFTCVIQAGYSVWGINNAILSDSVAATTISSFGVSAASTPAIPARGSQWSPYQANCAIPAQGRVDLITVSYPETL